jgi:hypothetical protein
MTGMEKPMHKLKQPVTFQNAPLLLSLITKRSSLVGAGDLQRMRVHFASPSALSSEREREKERETGLSPQKARERERERATHFWLNSRREREGERVRERER